MPIDLSALNYVSCGWNTPFATEIDDVGMNSSRNLDVYTNVHTRKGIETAEGGGINDYRNAGLDGTYQ